jgi:type I restriction enzyme S subunit
MSAQQLITDHLDLWTSAVTHKRSAGRGSAKSGKIELTGIKKLRELILELAVRGKLVEQDPNDEPASVLLERITEEKARLVKDGKIKKPKKLAEIPENAASFDQPNGWEFARLGTISDIDRGGSPRPIKSFFTDSHDGYNWIKIGDTDQGGKYITSTQEKITKEGLSKTRIVYPGDFLLTNSMSFGRPYITKIKGCIHDGWLKISPSEELDKDYLYFFLSSPLVKSFFTESAAGAVVQNLNSAKVQELLTPIPPFLEQRKIAQKVDELMTLCDRLEEKTGDQLDAHEVLVDTLLDALTRSTDTAELAENWARVAEHFDTLFTSEASIDKLKQTILQLAVMGRLVPQDPNDEPASVLLDKIAEEKERLVKEGKINKSKSMPAPNAEKTPFQVPKNWRWCRLESLSLHSGSGWSPQCNNTARSGDEWGVLKVSAVSWGTFNPDENKALPTSLAPRNELEIKPNDFLISRANTADLVARSVVIPEDAPHHLMMSDKIVRFAFSKQASTLYINLFNNSQTARDYYSKVAGGTSSSMKNVSRKQIHELLVPLPPAEEQHRIVEKVEELMALCDQLKARLSKAEETRSQLAETVVEQAVS